MKKLKKSFYLQETKVIAQQLLGKKLVHIYKNRKLSGIIVETEAYLGMKDKAAHSFGGKMTPRTQVMFLEGGHSYIYFIYGMYNCFNVVTKAKGTPEAVLIRAVEPVDGIEFMKKFRKTKVEHNLTSGPGKLSQALKIDKNLNAISLSSPNFYIEDSDLIISKKNIIAKPRIGIDYAEEAKHWKLRFYIKGNEFVSRK